MRALPLVSCTTLAVCFGACSNHAPMSRYNDQEQLVARIIDLQKSDDQIVKCQVWSGAALNKHKEKIPSDMWRKSVFSRIVWTEAAQVNSGIAGRLDIENFRERYEFEKADMNDNWSSQDIIDAHLSCVEQVEVASGGIDKILRASK